MSSYTLHIQYVDRPAETRTFTQPKVTFGRDSGDIVLHDTQVSGRHGEIVFDGSTLRYTDVGSTNGSFLLQGQRVANIELTPGIALRLGNSLITVQVIDAPNVAGKGRTVIAGPGMAPGFPAPMRAPMAGASGASGAPATAPAPVPRPGMPGMPFPAPAPPAAPPGGFAYQPTAQMQNPGMPPGMPGAGMPLPSPPASPVSGSFVPQPGAPFPGVPMGGPAPMTPVPMPAPITQPPSPLGAQPLGTQPPVGAQPMPGPPPGDFSGVPQSPEFLPMQPSPQPMAASGAAVAPVAGFANNMLAVVVGAWEAIKPQIIPATLITAILSVPMAVLGWFVLVTFGPFGFGALLLMVLALAQLAGTLILMPALVRFVLGVHLGQPVDIRTAIMSQVADFKTVGLNFLVFGLVAAIGAVFLIVPAIFVAVFIGQIYFVEGKRFGDAIGRNVELVKRDWVTATVNVLVPAIAMAIVLGVVGFILGVLPVIGGLMGALGRAVGQAVITPIILMMCTRMYFDYRRRFEGGDPEGEARARLGAPALPQA